MKETTVKEPNTDKRQKEESQNPKENLDVKAELKFKDRMFRLIYRDKKELLSLYNAVSGRHYTNAEDLIINTLENAIYMKMKMIFPLLLMPESLCMSINPLIIQKWLCGICSISQMYTAFWQRMKTYMAPS